MRKRKLSTTYYDKYTIAIEKYHNRRHLIFHSALKIQHVSSNLLMFYYILIVFAMLFDYFFVHHPSVRCLLVAIFFSEQITFSCNITSLCDLFSCNNLNQKFLIKIKYNVTLLKFFLFPWRVSCIYVKFHDFE
jgi:hypothetical protein